MARRGRSPLPFSYGCSCWETRSSEWIAPPPCGTMTPASSSTHRGTAKEVGASSPCSVPRALRELGSAARRRRSTLRHATSGGAANWSNDQVGLYEPVLSDIGHEGCRAAHKEAGHFAPNHIPAQDGVNGRREPRKIYTY